MRMVFDTNVFVSAFVVPGSHGERALLLAQALPGLRSGGQKPAGADRASHPLAMQQIDA